MDLFTHLDPPLADTPEPRIVWETARVTLWHGRAEQVLPGIETESVGLVLTDPPYGVGWESGLREKSLGPLKNDEAADRDTIREVLSEAVRCVAQHRHLYVFGPADVLEGLPISETTELVWDKGVLGAGDLAAPWGPAHEPISFAVSKHRHAGKAGDGSLAARLRKGSVLTGAKRTGRTVRHPTEKPVELLVEMIESSSRIGETVLDPFAGIASTGVAAIIRSRRALLIESDARWIPDAIRRVRDAEAVADRIDWL